MYGLPPDLLNAVAHAPGDDTPRLACADWLDEHDDPDAAAYIRMSVEAAALEWRHANPHRRARLIGEARRLFRAHRGRWLGPAAVLATGPGRSLLLVRGFPYDATVAGPYPPETLSGLSRWPTLARLALRDAGTLPLAEVARLGLWNLRRLCVYAPPEREYEWAEVRELLALPRLAPLWLAHWTRMDSGWDTDIYVEHWYAERRARFAAASPAEREWADTDAYLRLAERERTPDPFAVGHVTLFCRPDGEAETGYALDRLRAGHARGRPLSLEWTAGVADADLSAAADAQSLTVSLSEAGVPVGPLTTFAGARDLALLGRAPDPPVADLLDVLAGMSRLEALRLTGHLAQSPALLASLDRLPNLRTLSLHAHQPPMESLFAPGLRELVNGERQPQPADAEPVALHSATGVSLDIPTRLGDPAPDARGGVRWREWGDDAGWPHPHAPAVVRVWEVDRAALPADTRERLIDGDALVPASRVDPPVRLRPGGGAVWAMAWAGPDLCGLVALVTRGTRAARLDARWGASRLLDWPELARRMAASLRLG